ncbi:hypothetical protein BBK36DRAFT_1127665 [Trichoderma citrinoviride]|uniref:Uncharacterized protein n=1 Tax=Trichoderma citrinoviride TaxID=58853 RepID=A0A2T4B195_9HYPO|nr:hypothetical protein BBK36DRAFT_1127665 [Trichoderma citrinoviride]PTB63093.1 hypothetical protein BBK36DRAFT_1127665 [Trichoderma citrinoviride]
MPSLIHTLILALGMLQVAAASAMASALASAELLPGDFRPDLYQRAVDAGLAGLCTCPNLVICLGEKSQCTQDNKGAIICCNMGQRAFNGQCADNTASLCADGTTVCSGQTQCVTDNNGLTFCCAAGQKGVNGRCISSSVNLCSDNQVMCSGATPQCTVNVSFTLNATTGGTPSTMVCCANGQKAFDGKCYPGNAKLVPCGINGPCDFGNGYYCAFAANNTAANCCKQDSYLKGTLCVKKP